MGKNSPVLLDLLGPVGAASEWAPVAKLLETEPETSREPAAGAFRVSVSGPAGEQLPLPPEWQKAVFKMIREALAGRHVQVKAELGSEIGTEELAGLLGLSRPTVINLLEDRAIPFHTTP